MSKLVFLMGRYEASFPTDCHYAKNHMWARRHEDVYRFGFTAYAVRLLQDVYFLEWSIDEQTTVQQRQPIGAIESKKAESDLFAPIDGQLVRFNDTLMNDPSAINVEPYGDGWLFEIQAPNASLLSPDEYLEHLGKAWEVTQRTIKGQLQ